MKLFRIYMHEYEIGLFDYDEILFVYEHQGSYLFSCY